MPAKVHEILFRLSANTDAKFKASTRQAADAIAQQQQQAVKLAKAQRELSRLQIQSTGAMDADTRAKIKAARATVAMERAELNLAKAENHATNAARQQHDGNTMLARSLRGVFGLAAGYLSINALASLYKSARDEMNDTIAANTLLDTQLRNNGGTLAQVNAIRAYADVRKNATAQDDAAIVAGAAQLASFKLTSAQVKLLVPSMQNLATKQHGVNVTSEKMRQTALLLGKAATGQATALRRAGIVLTDQEQKYLKTATQAQRVNLLVRVMQQRYGGLAAAMARTPEGQVEKLRIVWGDLQEEMARRLTPTALRLMRYLTERLPQIQAGAERLLTVIERLATSASRFAFFVEQNWGALKIPVYGLVTALVLAEAKQKTLLAFNGVKGAITAIQTMILNIKALDAAESKAALTASGMWSAISGPIGVGAALGTAGYAGIELNRAKGEAKGQLRTYLTDQNIDTLAQRKYKRSYNQLGLSEQQALAKSYANEATGKKFGAAFNVGTGRAMGPIGNTTLQAAPKRGFHLPGFADGGIVTRPTIALIGEKGPEAIVPLTQPGAMGGSTIHFNPTINITGGASPQQTASLTVEELRRMLQQVLRDERRVSYAGS